MMDNYVFRTILFLLLFCSCLVYSLAVDTILENQTLSGDQTIVSSGGHFAFGFFAPGNSSKHYLGIWQNQISKQSVVWVANRDTPVPDKYSAQLKILRGNLVLLNESNIKIWSTDANPSSSITSVFALLHDNGNLVLRESDSTLSQPLWESIDYPTNTWLQGGKIGYDKLKQKKLTLTSWKSPEDPLSGLFSLEFDPNGPQCVTRWNGSEQYWTTGHWQNGSFSGIPEMMQNIIYNFSYVDNENESYFTYTLYNSSRISRFFMDSSGQMKHFFWLDDKQEWNLFGAQPRQQCDVYALCGAFGVCGENSFPYCSCLNGFQHKSESDWDLSDYSDGCSREIDIQCQSNGTANGRGYRFLDNHNMILPPHSQSFVVGSVNDCESACLSNCSCTAYAFDENGCLLWNSELVSLQQLREGVGSGRTISIKLDATSSVFSDTKSRRNVIIPAVVGSFSFIAVVVAVVVWRCLRHVKGMSYPSGGTLVAFGYKDLQYCTKSFTEKLGQGGFGSVFKGALPDSSEIAVKKLDSISQGEKQFRAEVGTIGTIQHVNLVRLHGFCSEGDNKLLVYEYLENGSLDSNLFNCDGSKVLPWRMRYAVALGIARGLEYLHEKCRECIIHCDIKPENILLDAHYNPKIADFGLAKLVGRDFSRVLTTMRGTRGYLAPEWISGVPITVKADVYSFGMMLFELVSGVRNSTHSEDGMVTFFPARAASTIIEDGDLLGLLDPELDRVAELDEVLKLSKIACWCIKDEECLRPSMGLVVQILEGVVDVPLPPMPESFKAYAEVQVGQQPVFFFSEANPLLDAPQTQSITNSVLSLSQLSAN